MGSKDSKRNCMQLTATAVINSGQSKERMRSARRERDLGLDQFHVLVPLLALGPQLGLGTQLGLDFGLGSFGLDLGSWPRQKRVGLAPQTHPPAAVGGSLLAARHC